MQSKTKCINFQDSSGNLPRKNGYFLTRVDSQYGFEIAISRKATASVQDICCFKINQK